MGISNIDDRELILSEIYALKNPEDMDVEMSLLGKYNLYNQIYNQFLIEITVVVSFALYCGVPAF